MDISTAFQQLNWLAVIAATLSSFLIGGLWYSSLLFEKSWQKVNNLTPDDISSRNMALVFGLSFVLAFVMALNLAMFIGQEGVSYGATAGFLAGFGWVSMAIGIISIYENRPLKYLLINGGYMIVSFTVMGAILGAWK